MTTNLAKNLAMINSGNSKKMYMRVGTWNIRTLSEKEQELVDEFRKANVTLIALTETKQKGKCELTLGEEVILYSGVEENLRAQAGVGCIIKKQFRNKNVLDWSGISDRIMSLTLEINKDRKYSLIILYGPNENDPKHEKDSFWEDVQSVCNEAKYPVIILGDLNGRVGNITEGTEGSLGRFGEVIKNANGERLIEFAINNSFIISNSFFEHKDEHKYTREVKSRNEKSIINYVLIEKKHRKLIKDVKVNRNAELGSDHHLVIAKSGIQEEPRMIRTSKKAKKSTKVYKLAVVEVRREYQRQINTMIIDLENRDSDYDLEQMWGCYKGILHKAAESVCGTVTTGGRKKKTHWWNKKTQEAVKKKKDAWKKYHQLGSRKNLGKKWRRTEKVTKNFSMRT
ncbi:craniofacial development protein 2-like [Zophobas morio]